MSNCNFDVRNEFSTSKLVEIDFLNTKMAKNKNSMVTSIFQWRPSWIAYCHLMTRYQNHYLIEKCYLGSLVPETIIKLRGPLRVSRVYSQVQYYCTDIDYSFFSLFSALSIARAVIS